MFTKEEIKRSLLGCFEVVLFMRAGVERFEGTREAAIRSFLIPLFLLPVTLLALIALSEGFSASLLLSLHTIRIVLSVVLFFAAVYFLSKQYDRGKYFYKFVTVANWINIPSMILVMPIVFALFVQGVDMESMKVYAVFITMLGYVYSAFIITHCFRFPWEMGGFIAIIGLAIDQNLLEFATYIRDVVAV